MNIDDMNLSPELREKAKACETPEEILALAKKEGYKLSDEEMEGIAGGWSCENVMGIHPEEEQIQWWS